MEYFFILLHQLVGPELEHVQFAVFAPLLHHREAVHAPFDALPEGFAEILFYKGGLLVNPIVDLIGLHVCEVGHEVLLLGLQVLQFLFYFEYLPIPLLLPPLVILHLLLPEQLAPVSLVIHVARLPLVGRVLHVPVLAIMPVVL